MEYGYHVGLLGSSGLDVVTRRGQHLVWRFDNPMAEEASEPHDHVMDYFVSAHRWFYAPSREGR